jgi:predicted PurR-regulated permease PerM
VAFERPLAAATSLLEKRVGIHRVGGLLATAVLLLGGLVTLIVLGVLRLVAFFPTVKSTLPDMIARVRETPLYLDVESHLGGADRIIEAAQRWAGRALEYLGHAGHIAVYAVIAFLLAIIYLLEKHELEEFVGRLDPASWQGTMLRWLGYVADAVAVTLQFQIVVALCNAILTFPVLLLVGIPHVGAFFLMIFLSGMVPVAGNFVAGAILTLLAYQARGWIGVLVFIVLTFVLHKLESYYLNPRLAARHVQLPGFVLVVSLILWEHLLGFVGLFVSFPFLYVVRRIQAEFAEEDFAVKEPPFAAG